MGATKAMANSRSLNFCGWRLTNTMNSTGHIRRLAIDTLVSDLLFLGYMPKSNLLFFAGEKRREEEKGKTISSQVLPAIASMLPYNLSYTQYTRCIGCICKLG
jgi:hypothetical protein